MSVTDLTKDYYESFTDEDGTIKSVEDSDARAFYHTEQPDDLGNGKNQVYVQQLFDYVPVHILMPWLRALTAAVNGNKDTLKADELVLEGHAAAIDALNGRLQAVLVVDEVNAAAKEEILAFAGGEDTCIFLFERKTGNAYFTSYRSVWDALSTGEPLKSLWDMDFDSEEAKATIQQALEAAEKAQAAAEAAAKQDQAGSVTNQKDSSALYFWSGTKEEYDADAATLPDGTYCYIEDDTTLDELWAAINSKAPAGNGYDGTALQVVRVTEDSDGSLLEAALDEVLAAMEPYSTRQIRVICTPYLEGYSYLVHLFKLADNDNAVVRGVGFRQTVRCWTKRKVEGAWDALETQTLTEAELLALIEAKAPDGYGLGKSTVNFVDDADKADKNGYFGLRTDAANAPALLRNKDLCTIHTVVRKTDAWTNEVQEARSGSLKAQRSKEGSTASDPIYGDWEYVNPQMVVGKEYRTTERFAGLVVYTKLIKCGKITANSVTTVAHGAEVMHAIRCCACCTNGDCLPNQGISAYANTVNVYVINNGITTPTVFAQIWYIKDYIG